MTVPSLRFEVLGPLRAWRGDEEVPLGSAKQRAVAGLLLLNTGRPVGREEIIDFLWGERPPATAVNTVQTYIKRLRQLMEPERVARRPSAVLRSEAGGYRLDLGEDAVDLLRFRALVSEARARPPAVAAGLLGAALELRRGLPLEDLGGWVREVPAVVAVEREIVAAALQAAEAGAAEVGPVLADLSARFPLDEPLHVALMKAYRSAGRQAEALQVFERVRALLRDELGVDPGPELRRAHLALLATPPDPPVPEPVEAEDLAWAGRRPPAEELVGRASLLRRVTSLVPERRLVTLTGPGGVGKTTLALIAAGRLAHRYAGGTAVVELGAMPADPARGRTSGIVTCSPRCC